MNKELGILSGIRKLLKQMVLEKLIIMWVEAGSIERERKKKTDKEKERKFDSYLVAYIKVN